MRRRFDSVPRRKRGAVRIVALAFALAGATLPLPSWAASAADASVHMRLTGATAPIGPGAVGPRVPLLAVDGAALADLRHAGFGTLILPRPEAGALRLTLARREIFAPGATITRTGANGPEPLALDVTLFAGTVEGAPGSWAVVTISAAEVTGTIDLGDRRYRLGPIAGTSTPGAHALIDERELPQAERGPDCGTADIALLPAPRRTPAGATVESATRLVCDIAIECDYEFYHDRFFNNAGQAATYATRLIGTVSAIYERDINTTLRISYLNVWTTSADPYVQGNRSMRLDEFRNWWNANRTSVSRHVAHMITGLDFGGVAYINVLCGGFGYGLAGCVGGSTFPSSTASDDVWLSAHELGHNFGSLHTQSCWWQANGYAPAGTLLDSCWTQEDGACYSGPTHIVPVARGTIMSYCDQLGAVSNTIRLDFHPACRTVMRLDTEASCLPAAVPQPPLVTAQLSGNDVELQWSANPPDVIRTDVYRSRFPLDLNPALIGSTTTNGFVDPDRMGIFYYKARAVRSGDQSDFSGEIRVPACPLAGPSSVRAGRFAWSPAAADLDGDGILDLVTLDDQFGSTVSILIGQGTGGVGNGTFAPPVYYPAGPSPSAVAIADLDGDGVLDLAITNATPTGSLSLLIGQGAGGVGNGTFAAPTSIVFGSLLRGIVAADLNEDGLVDLAVGDAGSGGAVSVLLGHGANGVNDGTFASPVPYPATGSPAALIASDFDADGILDLAVTDNVAGTVVILPGSGTDGLGTGAFQPGVAVPAGAQAGAIAQGDFDADGITDLAVTNASLNSVSVLLGQGSGGIGDGTFAPRVAYPASFTPLGVAVADLNDDGIADLVAANSVGSTTLSFLFGNGTAGAGDGTFAAPQPLDAGPTMRAVLIDDFDEDGAPDLAVARSGNTTDSASIAILRGGCARSLSSALTVLTPDGDDPWPGRTEQVISWSKGAGILAVDIAVTRDDGAHWTPIARERTGTSFTWTVTPGYGAARVRVADHVRPQIADESAGFTIAPPLTGVGSGPQRFGLVAIRPNPSPGAFTVDARLAGREPATLTLVDVSGRVVALRRLPPSAAGIRTVSIEPTAPLPAGLYFLRLAQGGRSISRKAVVAR